MNKPTEEQLKEFWERCGLKFESVLVESDIDYHVSMWTLNGKEISKYLALDLNNLFKYAVPKLMANDYSLRLTASKLVVDHSDSYNARITKFLNWEKDIIIQGTDPALALFWAIWEVTHG
jgi:hypothetical protein